MPNNPAPWKKADGDAGLMYLLCFGYALRRVIAFSLFAAALLLLLADTFGIGRGLLRTLLCIVAGAGCLWWLLWLWAAISTLLHDEPPARAAGFTALGIQIAAIAAMLIFLL